MRIKCVLNIYQFNKLVNYKKKVFLFLMLYQANEEVSALKNPIARTNTREKTMTRAIKLFIGRHFSFVLMCVANYHFKCHLHMCSTIILTSFSFVLKVWLGALFSG
jgi:hypothetical protein